MPAPDTASAPFPYGVASFEPSATGVLLWTRTAGPDPVRWEIATDPDLREVVAGGVLGARPDGESSVVVPVDGLAAGVDHFYRFTRGDQRSPVGRTRTLPADDRPLRLGLACCGDYSAGHFAAYRALAHADVDVVVHLGDYVYAEVEGDLRPVAPEGPAVVRADYRARYEQVRRDPDLQALHQRHPVFAVIDDHDLADNAHERGAKTHDPDEHGPWAARRDGAARERIEWLPIRPEGPPGRPERAQWRSVPLGTLGELVLLDTRLSGRDGPSDQDDGPPIDDPGRTMLGDRQRRWATERIADRSPGPWCLLVSSVVLNPMPFELPGRFRVGRTLPSGYAVEDGVAINTDGWDGYPTERDELTAALATRATGAVVLSGDVHSAWAFEGPAGDDGPVAVEFTCPAVTSAPMGEMIPLVGKAVEKRLAADDGVRWVDLYARGHLIVDVTPSEVTATWYFSDSEDLDAEARRGASWAVALDRPGRLEAVDVDPEHAAEPEHGAAAAGPPDQRRRQVPEPVPPRPAGLVAAAQRRRRRRRLAAIVAVAGLLGWWDRRGRDG